MNEIKLEGPKASSEQNSKILNSRKEFNFLNSPRNKNIKYLNLVNINSNQISKYISPKGNSSSKILSENFKKVNNIINNKINKKEKESLNERIFQKGVLNDKFESFLFKNKLKSKNNNKYFNSKPKIINEINSTTDKLKLSNEHKINLNPFMDVKYHPLISKFANKRSSSVINANKANEKLKEINNLTYKDSLFMTKYNNNEIGKIKMVKTPNKKIIIGNDKNIKEINYENNNNENIKEEKIDKNKVELEENHFKAVIYSQEIKRLEKNLN